MGVLGLAKVWRWRRDDEASANEGDGWPRLSEKGEKMPDRGYGVGRKNRGWLRWKKTGKKMVIGDSKQRSISKPRKKVPNCGFKGVRTMVVWCCFKGLEIVNI